MQTRSRSNIYISSSAFNKYKPTEAIQYLSKRNINNIELSFNKYEEKIFQKLKKLIKRKKQNFIFHNYFPRPLKDFVINLASTDDKVTKQTINHIKKNINFLSANGIYSYSFHSGFYYDLKLTEIGKSKFKKNISNKNIRMKIFIKNLNILGKYAKKKKFTLLIENNVLDSVTMKKFNKKPFLCLEYNEINKIFKKLPKNIKLLLDVAHLKVTSKTLKLNKFDQIKRLNKFVGAYHLSDNNGRKDSNDVIKKNSWFLKFLKKNVLFYTLEINNQKISTLKNQINILRNAIKQ